MLSALMWLLYLYFIRQALIDVYDVAKELLMWALAGAERPHLPAVTSFIHTLKNYGLMIVGLCAILISWALYNQLRFRGENRRNTTDPVTVGELAALYGLPAEDIASWQQARILVMRHDPADGTITRVVEQEPDRIVSARPVDPPAA